MAEEQETEAACLASADVERGMTQPLHRPFVPPAEFQRSSDLAPAGPKPSEAQRRYLSRGVDQPGGKLPLFDDDGRGIDRKTVESCIERGWAQPWFANPTKPGWLVCKLTAAGYVAVGENP